MARPTIPDPPRKQYIGTELEWPVYEAFKALAKAKHRTMADELRRLVAADLAEHKDREAA